MRARRRTFLGAALTLVPGAAAAQGPPPRAESGTVADGLAAAARARFAPHLAPDEVEAVKKEIEAGLRAGESLRAVPLGNDEEPVTTFAAVPRGGASRR
jgi:hypothetical protein